MSDSENNEPNEPDELERFFNRNECQGCGKKTKETVCKTCLELSDCETVLEYLNWLALLEAVKKV